MASEEVEYESDPEEAKRALTMRRREASDDEGGGESDGESGPPPRRVESRESRAGIVSDGGESDGGGAPAEYDDDDEEFGVEEEEEEELEEYEVEVVEGEEYERSGGKEGGGGVAEREGEGEERERDVGESTEEVNNEGGEEGKKENEPFAVPTAGAFYMHDDRFRDSAGGRNRRTLGGGRNLWESRDNKKWGHDKFEEMTLHDRPHEEGMRNSRGRYRARGKNRGAGHGYPGGNKSKAYNNNNQNNGPKAVRGRGPRRYEPSKMNNIEAPPTQVTQHRRGYGKSTEKTPHTYSGRTPVSTPNSESDSVPARKQVVASSLSSASPPFYPSASSNKEIASTQKREIQAGTISQSNTMIRGKNVVNAGGMEKVYINNSVSPNPGKPSTSLQLSPSGSSLVNNTQALHPRAHGGGVALSGQGTFQQGAPHNLVSRASPPVQPHNIQRIPAQTRVQPSVQQLGQRPGSGSQTSSPPKAGSSMNSFGSGELESPPESSKSKTALVGNGGVQVSGRSSFLYGGAQLMGASGSMGSGRGDQNFAAAPAFLPVMPFGGKHQGGMGVPAVGMAFPGYVAQPQLGMGNSEMTWLPVLAGAAGALGATYCSPYISVDGAYQSRQSGQTSSSGASRYTEMNFGQ
ncbi:hypothetical protein RHMOL_Rhmol08G0293900 [Rhododendron molle]|uniref:Uncharacterized protein n=1 Tax=Rhododendron molle TaxID=49168 RepID=A0ACC0MU19_RHOML|nr:hypothetical protein RHMOL_Rhmol08G0293900 [Rhododendron molle]